MLWTRLCFVYMLTASHHKLTEINKKAKKFSKPWTTNAHSNIPITLFQIKVITFQTFDGENFEVFLLLTLWASSGFASISLSSTLSLPMELGLTSNVLLKFCETLLQMLTSLLTLLTSLMLTLFWLPIVVSGAPAEARRVSNSSTILTWSREVVRDGRRYQYGQIFGKVPKTYVADFGPFNMIQIHFTKGYPWWRQKS